ncbi:hypothetical protein Cgig2_017521 [Carnegiea gigantea]|uniref:Uncharacterized protein n=1 Tax=Carnegiea gigantea TaxID=171969 RepID=A0A9Q1K446_9CARY|nr:hypothetical protein Cgig2_017521 [Carnegiea gigantea]
MDENEFPGGQGRGKTIERVHYWMIIHEKLTEEDVYATLPVSTGSIEVYVASTCKLTNEYTKLLKVHFRGKRCEDRWFLIITDPVEQRNKREYEFPRDHRRGKIIDRVDYQMIIDESEIELQMKLACIAQENQAYTKTSTSTCNPPPALELQVYIWIQLSLEEKDEKINGFQPQYIR